MKDRNGNEIKPGDRVNVQYIHAKGDGIGVEVEEEFVGIVRHLTGHIVLLEPNVRCLIPAFLPSRCEVLPPA